LTLTKDQPPGIELLQNRIIMRVRPGTDEHKRRSIAEEWYRGQVKEAVPSYRFEMASVSHEDSVY
jgi:hypothetical protein